MPNRTPSLPIIYSSQDWRIMERALQKAANQLSRKPDDRNRLARRIMILFDQGARDEDTIAQTAANQEILIGRIAALRTYAR